MAKRKETKQKAANAKNTQRVVAESKGRPRGRPRKAGKEVEKLMTEHNSREEEETAVTGADGANTAVASGSSVNGLSSINAPKFPKRVHAQRAVTKVTKSTQSRGRPTNSRGRGRPRKVEGGKQMGTLTTEHTKTTVIVNESGVNGSSEVNAPGSPKDVHQSDSQRLTALLSSPNPATVIIVPRFKPKFHPKNRRKNVGIVMADLGNWTTTGARALGLGELEDIVWNGAAGARDNEIRTRVVARKRDGQWHLEFGPETDGVCGKKGEVVVFDNMKLAMDPASKHFKLLQEKEKETGVKKIYQKFIQWVFHRIFTTSKETDPNIEYFRVYTALPPGWVEHNSYEYQRTIQNIPGWEGNVDVDISSEISAAATGRLLSMDRDQRKTYGVDLKDSEYGAILDVGDATAVRYTIHTLYGRY